jgi:hypothetical protein
VGTIDVRNNSGAGKELERSKARKFSKKFKNIKENPSGKLLQKYGVPKHTEPNDLMHSDLSNINESESFGTPFSLDDDSSSDSSQSNSLSRKVNQMNSTRSIRNKKKVTNIKQQKPERREMDS